MAYLQFNNYGYSKKLNYLNNLPTASSLQKYIRKNDVEQIKEFLKKSRSYTNDIDLLEFKDQLIDLSIKKVLDSNDSMNIKDFFILRNKIVYLPEELIKYYKNSYINILKMNNDNLNMHMNKLNLLENTDRSYDNSQLPIINYTEFLHNLYVDFEIFCKDQVIALVDPNNEETFDECLYLLKNDDETLYLKLYEEFNNQFKYLNDPKVDEFSDLYRYYKSIIKSSLINKVNYAYRQIISKDNIKDQCIYDNYKGKVILKEKRRYI